MVTWVPGELQFSAGRLNVPFQYHLGVTTCWDVHDARGKYCQPVIFPPAKNKLVKLHCLVVDLLLRRFGLSPPRPLSFFSLHTLLLTPGALVVPLLQVKLT